MATREELKQLIDRMPDEALPFVQETLRRWTPERSAAARLIVRYACPRAMTSDCMANGPMGHAMTSMTIEFVDIH